MSGNHTTERRISFSETDFALVDGFVADVQQHAICGLQNPTEFPERQMLRMILTDCTNLHNAIKKGVIE